MGSNCIWLLKLCWRLKIIKPWSWGGGASLNNTMLAWNTIDCPGWSQITIDVIHHPHFLIITDKKTAVFRMRTRPIAGCQTIFRGLLQNKSAALWQTQVISPVLKQKLVCFDFVCCDFLFIPEIQRPKKKDEDGVKINETKASAGWIWWMCRRLWLLPCTQRKR